MKTKVSMRDPARHHFEELFKQFWLHFGPIWLPKSFQSASTAPQERSQMRFETLFGRLWGSLGALLGRSWAPLGRFGALRALPGVFPRLFGSNFLRFWHGFGGPYCKRRRHSQRSLLENTWFPLTNATRCCAHLPWK